LARLAWNALGLTLASLGLLAPILAALLQEAGGISVVVNSALLLLYKQADGSKRAIV